MLKDRPNFFIRFFGHLSNILIHKYWVFVYCCKFHMPIRGILHDLSKLSPTEFWEGVRYYKDKQTSPINYAKQVIGYSKAWFHHRSHNKHHYEAWMDNFDQGGENILMPFKYASELICDYMAAGRTYYGKSFTYEKEYEWWTQRLEKPIAMHPGLQAYISNCLFYMATKRKFIEKDTAKSYYIAYAKHYRKG